MSRRRIENGVGPTFLTSVLDRLEPPLETNGQIEGAQLLSNAPVRSSVVHRRL